MKRFHFTFCFMPMWNAAIYVMTIRKVEVRPCSLSVLNVTDNQSFFIILSILRCNKTAVSRAYVNLFDICVSGRRSHKPNNYASRPVEMLLVTMIMLSLLKPLLHITCLLKLTGLQLHAGALYLRLTWCFDRSLYRKCPCKKRVCFTSAC